ncbi:MAG: tRNA (guanosine(37)-N1)-methyltransferase TrmD [Patescibacteria group bacterium]|jgi:tRNA (guanine37-N1)-methyltransferase
MRFDILTTFPDIFVSYFNTSIINRARKSGRINIVIHDLRDYTTDRHRTTDDRPYGGGPGMVMKVEPVFKALKKLRAVAPHKLKDTKVILLTPQGRTFNQPIARQYSELKRLIFICGHYEGFDERIRSLVDEQLSIGDYVLTGGELGAMVVVDAVSRLLPGVLGDETSSHDESFSQDLKTLEYPHYTRPEVFRRQRVPKILLSGDHSAIANWRKANQRIKKPRP